MTLIGIDIGTTHIKGGLFSLEGELLACASCPNNAVQTELGYRAYLPDHLWAGLLDIFAELESAQPAAFEAVHALGIASMAESGLLLDRERQAPRTPMIPWFETFAEPQVEALEHTVDLKARFLKGGLCPSFKFPLVKLLWLKETQPELLEGACWLGAAEYIAWRLSGALATEPTLAGRMYAFDLQMLDWDRDWLAEVGLPGDIFPPVHPSGAMVGRVRADLENFPQLHGTTLAVCGHDHICAAYALSAAAGGVSEEVVFNSMGTAEALVGAFPRQPLSEAHFQSGFNFGAHCAPGYLYWAGGLSASGGSVEWLRGVLQEDPALSYADLMELLGTAPNEPTGIIYLPYLLGSGSPHTDSSARGAFFELGLSHNRAQLARAVLEGTAYEMEYIRRKAEAATGTAIERILAAGGGTRNPIWMQIKADVSGIPVAVVKQQEATLLGAALLAGIGARVIGDPANVRLGISKVYQPDEERHQAYRGLFEERYLALKDIR